jgi:pimeloyl-ACP methyl ester carboxylesterase
MFIVPAINAMMWCKRRPAASLPCVIARALFILCVMARAPSAVAAELLAGRSGLQSDVIFSDYTPLARSSELVRRLLSPLNAMRVNKSAARSSAPLRAVPIDLASERFVVYVPAPAPQEGYALLVFVPPWETAALPVEWISALDRHATIYVSAARSGNGADVLDRREPLALLAVQNILQHFRVDPKRVYVGGLSGGGRVALRIALAYPDVFHGALLNAGSDAIGTAEIPLPPAELLREFQESTRLVYLTGARDNFHLDEDVASRQSLNGWCAFNLATETVPWRQHEILDAAAFSRGLDALFTQSAPDARKIAACRAHIDTALNQELRRVEEFIAAGHTAEGQRLLLKIDAHYGGLAGSRSVALAGQ